jgi:hypothetical protein
MTGAPSPISRPAGRPPLPVFKSHWLDGRTDEEFRILLDLSAGADVVIEGGGGAGKNRIVGHYLAERSHDAIAIDIVGRPTGLFRQPRIVTIDALPSLDHDMSMPGILWIDEANRYDLREASRVFSRYNQVIMTWSYGQGHMITEEAARVLSDRGGRHHRLQQNIRSTRPATGTLASLLSDMPVYEPVFATLERHPFNMTSAPSDPVSTALAISVVAVRYALSSRPLLVVISREETVRILRELGRQIPFPTLRVIGPDQLQGNDENVVIYPSAEAEPDGRAPLDVHDLEVIATRARHTFHLIVQGPTAAAFAPTEWFHMPLAETYSRFYSHLLGKGLVVEPRRQSLMLYDTETMSSALLLVLYHQDDTPAERHEARRLTIAALSRQVPASAINGDVLTNERFDPANRQLAAALAIAVRQKPGRRHADVDLSRTTIEDLRLRRGSIRVAS